MTTTTPVKKYKKSTIISEKSVKEANPERFYVDKKAFYEALVERKALVDKAKEENKPSPQISNFIGECILNIATNLARKYQFSGYPFKDDMISDAVIHCLRYIDAFDVTKDSKNPFSYFTQAAYYQFLKKIQTEKTQTYIKCKATMSSLVMNSLSESDLNGNDEHNLDNLEFDTDFMDHFISDFEARETKKINEKNERLKLKRESEINEMSLEYDEDDE